MDGSSFPETKPRTKSGPHIEKKLNAAFVRKAGPGRHADGGGLYLKVDPSGARRWILRTVVRNRRRDFGLGSANLVSLAEAREKAFDLRKIARSGGNPKVRTREDEGKATTFSELAHIVHSRKFKDNKSNGKHVAQWIRTLETYAFPLIGDLSVREIFQDEIEQVIDPIWTEKPETAKRVLQRISVVFDFACGRGYRTTGNPAEGLIGSMRNQHHETKNFVAMDYHDLPELMEKLNGQTVVGSLALRFTILTALRSGSVRYARWDHFDDLLTEWTIPAELMKTRNEFVVPITTYAREILIAAKEHRSKASELVFPSPSNPKKPISDATMRKLLQGYAPGITVHGMRAAFRTWAREDAVAPDDVAEMVLAHAVGSKVAQAYSLVCVEGDEVEMGIASVVPRFVVDSQDIARLAFCKLFGKPSRKGEPFGFCRLQWQSNYETLTYTAFTLLRGLFGGGGLFHIRRMVEAFPHDYPRSCGSSNVFQMRQRLAFRCRSVCALALGRECFD